MTYFKINIDELVVGKYEKKLLKISCAYYNKTGIVKQCNLNPIEETPIPFHTIHLDYIKQFETSTRKVYVGYRRSIHEFLRYKANVVVIPRTNGQCQRHIKANVH